MFTIHEGPLDLRAIAERLDGIGKSRSNASAAVGTAVRYLHQAFANFEDARLSANELRDAKAFSGSQAEELVELCEYLNVARMVMAEAAHAVVGVHPNRTMVATELDATAAAAKAGMMAKLLAGWEAESLKELVVKALAGDDPGTPGEP